MSVRFLSAAALMLAASCAAEAASPQVLHDFTSDEASVSSRIAYSSPVITAAGVLYGSSWRTLRSSADPYTPEGRTQLWKWSAAEGFELLDTLDVVARQEGNDLGYDNHAVAGTWLTLGADGGVYGLAEFSDSADNTGRFFRLDADDNYVELQRFPAFRRGIQYVPGGRLAEGSDPALRTGWRPQVPLTLGTDGNFYGAMSDGGTYYRMGALVRITPAGELTLLYGPNASFEGAQSYSPMAVGADGQLYGLNWHQSPTGVRETLGTRLYRLTQDAAYSVVYELFRVNFDPQNATNDSLIQGRDGYLYGTSYHGGDDTNQYIRGGGVIYRVKLDGNDFARVHTFSKPHVFLNDAIVQVPSADGAIVNPGLVQDADGNLYGTTQQGGGNLLGTVFRIDSAGRFSTLYSFPALDVEGRNGPGASPRAGLVLSADGGTLYGTTALGGAQGRGTLFALEIEDPVPQVAISWTFNPIVVGADLNAGGATILTWNSAGAESCTASGGGNAEDEWEGARAVRHAAHHRRARRGSRIRADLPQRRRPGRTRRRGTDGARERAGTLRQRRWRDAVVDRAAGVADGMAHPHAQGLRLKSAGPRPVWPRRPAPRAVAASLSTAADPVEWRPLLPPSADRAPRRRMNLSAFPS